MKHVIVCLLAWAAAALPAAAQDHPAAPVIAAERAFAADGASLGWAEAFRRWHAPGALTLAPGPTAAAAVLAQVEGPGVNTLDWRPAFAGISRDGAFGFTTGPFLSRGENVVRGHYFTVWRRQPDGTWRWVFDAGAPVADPDPPIAPDADIPVLPVADEGAASAEAAMAEVAAIEADAAGLHASLAPDVRVNRPGAPPAIGAEAGEALFAAGADANMTALHREAAASGDMVFSLGEVRDRHEGVERVRYYARIWQRRAEGWRIVFDEIAPGPPPS